MKSSLIVLMMILSLISCRNSFKDQFKLEVEKMKPKIKDKNLEKIIYKIANDYEVDIERIFQTVDLNHARTGRYFIDKLLSGRTFPASTHQIEHLFEMPIEDYGEIDRNFKNDKWGCEIAVAQTKRFNKVSVLAYSLNIQVDTESFAKKAGVHLPGIEDEDLAEAIFYTQCLKIIRTMPNIYDFTKDIK